MHPQTVRYRLARLRERFGDALDDPDARFELALALRSPVSACLATGKHLDDPSEGANSERHVHLERGHHGRRITPSSAST